MGLARSIYTLTGGFPRSERFGLTDQTRRAAVSVPSNIAEGHGRLSDKSFAVFLSQARGSLNELQTQLELSIQLEFSQPVQCSACTAGNRRVSAYAERVSHGPPAAALSPSSLTASA